MAFNSATYRKNKYRREAYAYLAQARDIKARAAAGTASDWEPARIASLAFLARNSIRLFRSARAICAINAEIKRIRLHG